MVEVEEAIGVDASPDEVFDYLDDPHNHVEVTPSLVRVGNVERLENGGKRTDYAYSIAGVELAGELVQTVHEPGERMVFEMRGGLSGEIEIRVAPEDGGARVTYRAEYDIPGKVLSRVAEPFVRRYNERELRTLLGNLKTRLEAGAPANAG